MPLSPWSLASLILLLPAAAGHLALWVAAFNLLHATRLAYRAVHQLERPIFLAAAGMPLWFLLASWNAGRFPWDGPPGHWLAQRADLLVLLAYAIICWIAAAVWTVRWFHRRFLRRVTPRLAANDTRQFDVAAELGHRPLGGKLARLLDRVPGNEVLTLHVQHKRLAITELDPRLEGLKIAHLSDLHFTGRVGRPYFEFVVEQVNAWDPDLVVVSGDIVDKTECQAWIPHTLGRLRAVEGKYFVLGNHDLRVSDVRRLREELTESGLEDLGGRWRQRTLRGAPVLLAGNEHPWFDPRPRPPARGATGHEPEPLRLLLAHTPDQFDWARRHQFDLMLAGHTHGGQIRLPLLGPIVAPSRHGVTYASGTFYRAPTLMHVSRGISGLHPIRWNCPPELALLSLTRAE